MDVQYLVQGSTRLINLGLYGQDQVGFPICPKCGAVRNPRASESEIADFMKHHMESCRVQEAEEFWSALHADIQSDLLIFDEFKEKADAVNFMEALKIGAYRLLDMQEGDLDATIETKSNDAYRVIFFDPLPGGSGFLPLFFELYTRVIEQSLTKLKDCDCEESCYKCMLSFTNQQHHNVLNRFEAMDVLERYKSKPVHKNSIPPVMHVVDTDESEEECDSDAECAFIKYLEKKDFPRPDEQQYRVELSGGSYTVADFAYREKKVLIFIDGLSEGIHGNPHQAAKDDLLRAKAKMKGFNIVALSAQAMGDDAYMSMIMEMISMYLGEG
jgi:very-short-patch-repair endonuclease